MRLILSIVVVLGATSGCKDDNGSSSAGSSASVAQAQADLKRKHALALERAGALRQTVLGGKMAPEACPYDDFLKVLPEGPGRRRPAVLSWSRLHELANAVSAAPTKPVDAALLAAARQWRHLDTFDVEPRDLERAAESTDEEELKRSARKVDWFLEEPFVAVLQPLAIDAPRVLADDTFRAGEARGRVLILRAADAAAVCQKAVQATNDSSVLATRGRGEDAVRADLDDQFRRAMEAALVEIWEPIAATAP